MKQSTRVLSLWVGEAGTVPLLSRPKTAAKMESFERDRESRATGCLRILRRSGRYETSSRIVAVKANQKPGTNRSAGFSMSLLHFRCKERRRTQRVALTVPLVVHGQAEDGEKFCLRTNSVSVSQHGAAFELAQVVVMGQTLRLVNENSNRKVECHVVNVHRRRDGRVFVGVEFNASDSNFWSMTFPPPNARPLRKPFPAKVIA